MSEFEATRARGARDRTSALPDAVLCHILSFLDTAHDAVATCVLSKRWRNIWASVPSLHLWDGREPEAVSFLRFVDNVLFFRDSTDIRKFLLKVCCVEDFARINGWIGTAIRHNVVELVHSVDDHESDDPQVVELPESVFTCKTQMVLDLSSNFIISPPASGCFPSLKSLSVQFDHPVNKSVEKLLSCYPVLENLSICGSHGSEREDSFLNFNISAPELKTLRIVWSSYDVDEKRCKFLYQSPEA